MSLSMRVCVCVCVLCVCVCVCVCVCGVCARILHMQMLREAKEKAESVARYKLEEVGWGYNCRCKGASVP